MKFTSKKDIEAELVPASTVHRDIDKDQILVTVTGAGAAQIRGEMRDALTEAGYSIQQPRTPNAFTVEGAYAKLAQEIMDTLAELGFNPNFVGDMG